MSAFALTPSTVMQIAEAYMLNPAGEPPIVDLRASDLPALAGGKVRFHDPFKRREPEKGRVVEVCARTTPTGLPRAGFQWSPRALKKKLILVSSSGGIDSVALLVLARKKYPKAMILIERADTGMEPADTMETLLSVARMIRAPIVNLLPPKSLPEIMRDRGIVVNPISAPHCTDWVKGSQMDKLGCWLVRGRKRRTTIHLSGLLYEEPSRVYTHLLLQRRRFGELMAEEALLYNERITKAKAIRLLQRAGLPISTTYFDRTRHGCVPCKNWTELQWKRFFQSDPEGFGAASALEQAIAKEGPRRGSDPKGKVLRIWLLGRESKFPKGLYLKEWLRIWDQEDPGWRSRPLEAGILRAEDLSCGTPAATGRLPVLTQGAAFSTRVGSDVDKELRKDKTAHWRKAVASLGQKNTPFPLPPELNVGTIDLGSWTAIPAQTKPRWSPPLKLWKLEGPRKSLGLWVWKKADDWIVLRLKQGRRFVGHVSVTEQRHKGKDTWVVGNSYLKEELRGTGLGSLLYLATRAALDAYEGKPVTMIPTSEYLSGTGTSPQALKVWGRLRGEGRLNRIEDLVDLGYTKKEIDRALKALERTPSGRDAGPRGASVGLPPKAVQAAALKGLKIRASMPPSRRGGTDIGVGRAIQLALGRPISERAIRRMRAYFSRHARDERPYWDAPGDETKGFQAWLLWGGDPGQKWAERKYQEIK